MRDVKEGNLEHATFAAGCFWGVEETFRNVRGVGETEVGYTGGKTEHPSYEDVCRNKTGHAEVVRVVFDPKEVSYEELLKVFWGAHDPTQKNRQGPDVGSQYRSAIFYHNDEQKKAALKSKAEIEKLGVYKKPIITEIVPAGPFFRAEEYHQRYFEKHGVGVCRT